MPKIEARGTYFGEASLVAANLQGASLRHASFTGSTLDHALFIGADLRETMLDGVQAREASFQNAKLWYSDLSNADIAGADFSVAQCTRTNLHNVKDEGTKWDMAILVATRKTDLERLYAEQAEAQRK